MVPVVRVHNIRITVIHLIDNFEKFEKILTSLYSIYAKLFRFFLKFFLNYEKNQYTENKILYYVENNCLQLIESTTLFIHKFCTKVFQKSYLIQLIIKYYSYKNCLEHKRMEIKSTGMIQNDFRSQL